jgi:hypothetical protein
MKTTPKDIYEHENDHDRLNGVIIFVVVISTAALALVVNTIFWALGLY